MAGGIVIARSGFMLLNAQHKGDVKGKIKEESERQEAAIREDAEGEKGGIREKAEEKEGGMRETAEEEGIGI